MNKRSNTLILAAGAAVLVAAAVHAAVRLPQTSADRERLAVLERNAAQTVQTGADVERLHVLFPPNANVAAFVEELSVLAQRSGLRNLDISTQSPAVPRPAPKPAASQAAAPPPITFYPIKISFDGNYQAVSEYVRTVQNMVRFKRLVQVEMRPTKQAIRATVVVEIAAFEAGHAS